MKATLDATADGILVTDGNGKIVTFNQQFVAMWRIPPEIAASRNDDQAIGFVLDQLKDPGRFVTKVMELYGSPEAESVDTLEFKDGRLFERRSKPRWDGNKTAGRVWSFRDITDLVRTERELSRAVSRVRAALDATADGLLIVDLEGNLVDFNRKAVEMWGIPHDIVVSLDAGRLREHILPQLKDPDRFLKKMREIYSEPERQSFDWLTFLDGRVFERYSRPQKIGDQIVGRVWSFRDVTKQKRLEEQLQEWKGGSPAAGEPAGPGDPKDVETLDGILRAFYAVISGPAGEPRQWSRDRSLYLPGARQVATGVADDKPFARAMGHAEYVERSNDAMVREGFFEREIHRTVETFGNLAHVFSTYESRRTKDGPIFARGVNSIDLYFDGGRWWITSVIWDSERPESPIPEKWLPV
ncbi:MAG: PAS domain-containing protein [Thermoanaerobaculia bacterium]